MPAIDQTRTKRAYGLQWNRFRIIRAEEDRVTFFNRTGLSPADLDGKLVLDAGCGMGRYLRIAALGLSRGIVGMDLSRAVEAARELTAELPGVAVVRGDMLRLPFSDQTFDIVYSLGVVDHTPDPRGAFLGLARLLDAGRADRDLGLPPRTTGRRADHADPASDLDANAARIPRVALPDLGAHRRPEASSLRQPALAGPETGGGAASLDDRRLDASRSRSSRLRHP